MNSHNLAIDTARPSSSKRKRLVGSTAIVFLRQDEVERRTGLSTSQRDRLEALGQFPTRVAIGPRSVGWVEAEISDWQRARIALRNDAEHAEKARLERMPPNRRQPARTEQPYAEECTSELTDVIYVPT
jgi:prophage regulatory protein